MRDLPSGWSQVTLQAITQEHAKKVGAHQQITVLSSTKHHGLVPSDEYFKGRTIYSDDLANYKVVERDWFAYATNHLAEGSIGLQEAFDFSCVSPIYTVFSCRRGVDARYLFRVLKSPGLLAAYRVHEQASVDRRGAVRYRDFGKIEIKLPPEDEQRRIAEILDTVDTSISARDRIIDKINDIQYGLTENLLGSIAPNDAPLGSYLASTPKNGFSPKEADEWTGVYSLGLGCLTSSGFMPRQLKYVSAGEARNKAALLNDGDLLMSRANTRDLVGLAGIYRDIGSPCIYPDLMMRLIPTTNCRPEYLELLLRSGQVRRQIQAVAQGTSESMVKISGPFVQQLKVTIPTLAEQDRILNILAASRAEIEYEKNEREKLFLLRQGLTEDLLSGRFRVSEAHRAPKQL
ncbi:type I restriction enzyme, S subunit [Nocardia amikacinitolerans]|uniref:restriction endonuclease subunit S n=1 Tax=Nocardia amikacinitolerans TaxID=756689 RepID=UPI000A06B784|nr:restriction endonuclease subunit S [Nocardia amikacinitolerans]MCP2318256.1 type I restriction enzyme, S subunit [Nocardia amikacinitolerans]